MGMRTYWFQNCSDNIEDM